MGRLQQLNPRNYRSSAQISEEFESLIRYIGAAERGNKTLSELLGQVFDSQGNYSLDFTMRVDADGLEYRVGSDEQPWETVVSLDRLRGPAGRDVGEVALPILHQRVDITAATEITVVNYVHGDDDFLFVLRNGILMREGDDFVSNPAANTITFTPAIPIDSRVTIYKSRGGGGADINRQDFEVIASQSVFGIILPDDDALTQFLVYLNGILLAENDDYVISRALSTITLLSAAQADDLLSVVTIASSDATSVSGFMLEGIYTDPATGLIPVAKVQIPDGALDLAMVGNLAEIIEGTAQITVSPTPPVDPETGDLWLDTSETPNALKFWNASEWLRTSPTSSLPPVQSEHANLIVAVNSTGTGYVYRAFETTGLIPRSEKGASGGVATLGIDGRLSTSQQPEVRVTDTIYFTKMGAITDGTLVMRHLFGEKIRLKGMSVRTTSGSATLQIAVSGANVGGAYSVTSVANDVVFVNPIEIDAISLSKTLQLVVSGASSPNDLFVTLIVERLN